MVGALILFIQRELLLFYPRPLDVLALAGLFVLFEEVGQRRHILLHVRADHICGVFPLKEFHGLSSLRAFRQLA